MTQPDIIIWSEKGEVLKAFYSVATKRLRVTKMVTNTNKAKLIYVKSNVDCLEWASFKNKVLKCKK